MIQSGPEFIKKIKKLPLPGDAAHVCYSPPYRPEFNLEKTLATNPNLAAVNILLYQKNGAWHLPLILRTENERDKHSGQISLPGGKKDPEDRDFWDTARRETQEEIGLDRVYIRKIRKISPLYIPPSRFLVWPYLSYTKKNPEFTIQQTEANELISLPVEHLLALPDEPLRGVFSTSRGIEVPYIPFQEYKIWGATSMILYEFREMLRNL